MASKKRILIVDDEELFARNLTEYLNQIQDHYEAECVYTGEEALKILGKSRYDLVITDIKMQGLSGLELLDKVRKKYPRIGVIVMTAYGLPETEEEASNRGSLYYIEKPFEMNKLEDVIATSFEFEKGFEGHIASIQLTDLIQLNCLRNATNAITVVNGDQKGIIYFKDGEIIHSVCGSLEGEEALFTILSWDSGYITTNYAVPDKKTIDKAWCYLLIEGTRRSGESAKARAAEKRRHGEARSE
jgi:CheY-like chemotaxis protein